MTRTRATMIVAAMLTATVVHPVSASSDLSGRVLFSGLAVPGATVIASNSARKLVTASNASGEFMFAGLDDGVWTLRVEMRGFVDESREISLPLLEPPIIWSLTMRPYAEIVTVTPPPPSAPAVGPDAIDEPPDLADVINGSVNNGAATPFAQPRSFGNDRPSRGALYSGAMLATLGNSAWNARPFSFGRSPMPAPDYGDVELGFTISGPLKIPGLVKSGPQSYASYQHSVMHNAVTQSALMPTTAERSGDFSAAPIVLHDPDTGLPFPGNTIPLERISPQAAALVTYFPLPNAGTAGANYQTPVLSTSTRDHLQLGITRPLSNRTTLTGAFVFQRTLTDSVDLFAFADRGRESSLDATTTWTRRVNTRRSLRLKYQFTRATAKVTPFFANRANVSGSAGIAGNSQYAADWGPPTLSFPDIADLRDGDGQQTVTQSHAVGAELLQRRGRHNLTIGGDVRRSAVETSAQADPRGTLAFTGAASGSAFADFLLGLPATSALGFGNATTRLRGTAYDAYFIDDFRVRGGLTLNLGVRWEYEAPFTEASGHLANLDLTPGFTAARPVIASNAIGPLTGRPYPESLVRADKRGLQPRVGLSWRPVAGSTLVVRASYGVYRNLGLYQSLGLLLAQQPPFARAFSVANSALIPLTLANAFPTGIPSASTFAVDPDFRSGYAHTWQVTAQRDLPASLTVIAAYLGAKGEHLTQASLPNTSPPGSVDPCPACPSGFVFLTSNGSSLRNAGQFTVRRRLHNGLTASAQYTLAKSTDDAATFTNTVVSPKALAVAQDWLALDAERGASSFDQRHLMTVQFQYTSGIGVAGGTLVDGVRGALLKDWTITSSATAGSGLPATPISFVVVPGTGMVGVRPSLTGVAPDSAAAGYYANPAAFVAPQPGTWGDARRNSLRGPRQFLLDMSLARVFRLRSRFSLEWRVTSTNVLNRVTFATIDNVISSPQFGRPTVANAMRRINTTVRLRF